MQKCGAVGLVLVRTYRKNEWVHMLEGWRGLRSMFPQAHMPMVQLYYNLASRPCQWAEQRTEFGAEPRSKASQYPEQRVLSVDGEPDIAGSHT